jgi:hypothetical protein
MSLTNVHRALLAGGIAATAGAVVAHDKLVVDKQSNAADKEKAVTGFDKALDWSVPALALATVGVSYLATKNLDTAFKLGGTAAAGAYLGQAGAGYLTPERKVDWDWFPIGPGRVHYDGK